MKYLKPYSEFNFDKILDKIINELKNRNLYDDLYTINKSQTKFGQSWYLIFKNKLEIRISNHSVTSTQRLLDNKYVAFLYTDKDYSKEEIEKVIDDYIKYKSHLIEKNRIRMEAFDKQKDIENIIKNNTTSFIEKLKLENKAIFDSNKTYSTLDEIKEKHPDWEFVCQIPFQNAFRYFYIKTQNGYGFQYFPTSFIEYYNFLVNENQIDGEVIKL